MDEDRLEARSTVLWPDTEIRATPDGFGFDGYAAVFDTPSVRMAFPGVNGGRPFREVIHRGAFAKTLSEAPVIRLLWQHDEKALPLASTRNGSLSLAEDERGLRVSGTLPDDEWGRPVRNAIADGRIVGMSFRFQKVLDKFSTDAGEATRHLHEVRLVHEVSVTDSPAYPATTAAVRSAGDEPEVWLTADELQALRAGMPTSPTQPCCDACRTSACCGPDPAIECPGGCPGCALCDCAGDQASPADQGGMEMDSAPVDESYKAHLSAKRALLGEPPE